MAKKISTGMIALAVVGGFAVLVVVDHYVLKGKLGISGRINQLIGKLKQSMGSGAGPITSTLPTEGVGEMPSTEELSGVLEGLSTNGGGMEEEEEVPETVMRARALRARARRRGYSGRQVRLGGFHP